MPHGLLIVLNEYTAEEHQLATGGLAAEKRIGSARTPLVQRKLKLRRLRHGYTRRRSRKTIRLVQPRPGAVRP